MSVHYQGFQICKANFPSMLKIKTLGRGSLPNSLLGSYTSEKAAKEAIDSYVSSKAPPKKVKSNATKN